MSTILQTTESFEQEYFANHPDLKMKNKMIVNGNSVESYGEPNIEKIVRLLLRSKYLND